MAKTKTIENLFVLLSVYTDLLPILLFLIFFNHVKNNRVCWLFVLYLLFDFTTNFSLLYLIPAKFHNRIYPFFTFFETIFFASFFYSILSKPSLRKLVIISTVIFSTLLVAYYFLSPLLIHRRQRIDSIPIGIETILIFIFSFIYFFEQLNDTTELFIYSQPSFWGVLGILLCLAGSFFIYIFANQIDFKDLGKYWIITNISVIVRNLFFAVAIFIQANQSIKKPPGNFKLYPSH